MSSVLWSLFNSFLFFFISLLPSRSIAVFSYLAGKEERVVAQTVAEAIRPLAIPFVLFSRLHQSANTGFFFLSFSLLPSTVLFLFKSMPRNDTGDLHSKGSSREGNPFITEIDPRIIISLYENFIHEKYQKSYEIPSNKL